MSRIHPHQPEENLKKDIRTMLFCRLGFELLRKMRSELGPFGQN